MPTGLRILAEALTLLWENVDLARGFLTVRAGNAKGKQMGKLLINSIPVETLAWLKENATSDWVFVNRSDRHCRSIRTAFENAFRHAKLAGI